MYQLVQVGQRSLKERQCILQELSLFFNKPQLQAWDLYCAHSFMLPTTLHDLIDAYEFTIRAYVQDIHAITRLPYQLARQIDMPPVYHDPSRSRMMSIYKVDYLWWLQSLMCLNQELLFTDCAYDDAAWVWMMNVAESFGLDNWRSITSIERPHEREFSFVTHDSPMADALGKPQDLRFWKVLKTDRKTQPLAESSLERKPC